MDLGRRIARNAGHGHIGRSLIMRALLSALVFFSPSLSAQAGNDIAEIQQRLEAPVIVDVRSEGECASGAIEGALNHPLQGLPDTLLNMGVELDEEVIVYCRSGRRSAQAKTLLNKSAFN